MVGFLRYRDFKITDKEIPTGYRILGEDSPHFKPLRRVEITVEGKPDDFTVEFGIAEGRKKRRFWISPFLLSMFGGGHLHLKQLKSNEVWIKLEKEFRKYLQNVLLQLNGSMELSRTST